MRPTSMVLGAVLLGTACTTPPEEPNPYLAEYELALASDDYCALPATASTVLVERPSATEEQIDDINWFARPVMHDGTDFIVAYASHNQNYLYNLSAGVRVKIPDRSDAVATPDGRFMTVPANYTPDSTIRFYHNAVLLDHLARGKDADHIEPVFAHDRDDMSRTYYQSTAVLSADTTGTQVTTTYRLMFSGTGNRSQFRITDYEFMTGLSDGEVHRVTASEPMLLCREITNDLNTPFISKDGRYIASYSSPAGDRGFVEDATLKIFEVTATDPAAGTASCREVADLGITAGKADFSFDGTHLTFHTSQGAYLTPFINGGLPTGTITDVVVARLARDEDGAITGLDGMQRLTTSTRSGTGSYFPAFMPNGSIFYIANAVPRDSEDDKRFSFYVVDPFAGHWRTQPTFAYEELGRWQALAHTWENACSERLPVLGNPPFPTQLHQAAWLGLALSQSQCVALVGDAESNGRPSDDADWEGIRQLCDGLQP